MVTPIRLNFTSIGGPDVPGYTKVITSAYNAGQGYGYEDAIDSISNWHAGLNPDPRYDSAHVLGPSGALDDFRVDVPVLGETYDVMCVMGDAFFTCDHQISISDAGANPITLASGLVTAPNSFLHLGGVLKISSYLRLRTGRALGAPHTTAIAFMFVTDVAERRATMRQLAPRGTRRIP